MRVTDAQVRKLRAEMIHSGRVGVAAARAGMSRNTATKYLATNQLPSELREPRTWRTRRDPFEDVWPAVAAKLREQPGLQARTLFEELMAGSPDAYRPGQLRTLQRRVKQWRAQEGPDKELFLPQDHRPGEAMQTDFTSMNSLGITIAGEPYDHLLCHSVLPFSDWSFATPCRSESMAAIKRSVQVALVRLGHVPRYHQTDNSTAATHRLDTGKRAFNEEYLAFMAHVGMEPRTTAVACKEQNGDVEASNGALKRTIDQQLMLRGSRDFASHEQYLRWLHDRLDARNRARGSRLAEELAAMRPYTAALLPEYIEMHVRVGSGTTILVKSNTYSVPSRLRGEMVRVRVYDDRLEILHGDVPQLTVERLQGKKRHRINYRHVVPALLRKPGAFRRYRYRDALFPTQTFRRAFERLEAKLPERQADLEYLRILELAATTLESAVEAVIDQLLATDTVPRADEVHRLAGPPRVEPPALEAPMIDLTDYDSLLVHEVPA